MLNRLMLALALIGTSAVQQTGTPPTDGRWCGVLTAYTHGTPDDKCDVQFELKPDGRDIPLNVVVRRAARPGFANPPENLYQQDVCVSGAVTMKEGQSYLDVTSASQLTVRDSRQVEPFGVGAVSSCDDSTITAPHLVADAKPSYTPEAMRARIQGVVLLEAVVGIDGRIGDVRVTRSLDPGLDVQAVRALRQWVLTPGTRRGEPAPTVIAVEIRFTLRDRR